MATTTASVAPEQEAAGRRSRPLAPRLRKGGKSFLLTLVATCAVAAFLAPMLQSASLSLKTREQITELGAPLWPADPVTYNFQGRNYDVFLVPIDGQTRELRSGPAGPHGQWVRRSPAPGAGQDPVGRIVARIAPLLDLRSTLRELQQGMGPAGVPKAAVQHRRSSPSSGMIGVLVSCTLVAYGFARFRFPGRNLLFVLLISTIFLPSIVTTIPTYAVWRWLGVIGSSNPLIAWAPLLVPTFFANAYDVFLMRQYFMTIPREMDEAAAMDGAGPFRTLISVILPQSWPVIIAVGIFHFVYSWNNFFEPLIYLPHSQSSSPSPSACSGSTASTAPSRPAPGRHVDDA